MTRGVVETWHLDLLALGLVTGALAFAGVRGLRDRGIGIGGAGSVPAVVLAAATGLLAVPAALVVATALAAGSRGGRALVVGGVVTATVVTLGVWTTPLIGASTGVMTGAVLAASGRRPAPAGATTVPVVGLAVAAVAVWAQAPDTEAIVVVAPAVLVPLLVPSARTVDAIGTAAVLVLWAAGAGAEGRPAAIVGVWSVAVLLAGALLWAGRGTPPEPTAWTRAVALVSLPGALALVAARTVGLDADPAPAPGLGLAAATAISWLVLERWAPPGRAAARRRAG